MTKKGSALLPESLLPNYVILKFCNSVLIDSSDHAGNCYLSTNAKTMRSVEPSTIEYSHGECYHSCS